jgi:hypothetical protein
MADITMCGGKDCPLKEKCYRFTAPKSKYGQSYFFEAPGETEDDITMEEAREIMDEQDLAKMLQKHSEPKPKVTVDDILHKLRTRNSDNQLELAYQNVINQLEHITTIVSEQEHQFTLYELRDMEWYMDTIKNRLYWILRQREDL